MRRNTKADIYRRIDMSDDPDACWPWTGLTDPAGYGYVRYEGSSPRRVHILIYEWEWGLIPDGFTIHHTCFNTTCANPRHLRLLPRGRNAATKKIHQTNICKHGHDLKITGKINSQGRRYCTVCLKATQEQFYDRLKAGEHQPKRQTECKREHGPESMKQHPDGRWYCAECKRITNKKPPVPKSETCKNGHDYATHGTIQADGTRRCVTCHNERRRERHAAKKS